METYASNLDKQATKARTEEYLKRVREYKVTEYIPIEPQITQSYEVRYHGYTGTVSDSTASVALRNLEETERRRRHIERVEKAVARLGTLHQSLIRKRYIDDDFVSDTDLALDLGYSERHYRRIKSDALLRLSLILGLVVTKEEGSEGGGASIQPYR